LGGSNYGWANCEGFCIPSNPSFRDPIFTYDNTGTQCAITGGTFYNPQTIQFPSNFVGNYFFADFCGGWIRRLDPASGNAVSDFATGISAPVDLKVSPDGFLYYLARGAGSVNRIGFDGSGCGGDTIPPTVSITNPADGAIVTRKSTVTGSATASDNVGVTRVEFWSTVSCGVAIRQRLIAATGVCRIREPLISFRHVRWTRRGTRLRRAFRSHIAMIIVSTTCGSGVGQRNRLGVIRMVDPPATAGGTDCIQQ
jgi:hypothetical protein